MEFSNPDVPGLSVSIFIGEDGASVVQIETQEGIGRIRVNVNDGTPVDEEH